MIKNVRAPPDVSARALNKFTSITKATKAPYYTSKNQYLFLYIKHEINGISFKCMRRELYRTSRRKLQYPSWFLQKDQQNPLDRHLVYPWFRFLKKIWCCYWDFWSKATTNHKKMCAGKEDKEACLPLASLKERTKVGKKCFPHPSD